MGARGTIGDTLELELELKFELEFRSNFLSPRRSESVCALGRLCPQSRLTGWERLMGWGEIGRSGLWCVDG